MLRGTRLLVPPIIYFSRAARSVKDDADKSKGSQEALGVLAHEDGSVSADDEFSDPDSYTKPHFDQRFATLSQSILSYNQKADIEILQKSYEFSYKYHQGQLRRSGIPYFDHCMSVVEILGHHKLDVTTMSAAFLHDTVEDTDATLEQLEKEFSVTIAALVDGVTKIGGIVFTDKLSQQAENFRKMLLSITKDIRVIIIKLADRLHNMRTLDFLPEAKRKRIAIETRDVYAPLANRFGIASIKWELEDLVLRYLEPEGYQYITSKITENREEREAYIKRIAEPLQERLSASGIKAEITGRPKHFFSIFNKMKKRNKSFDEIYDLLAVRIVVNSTDECYSVLGTVHSVFTPVADRFKDYVATPKLNGYQSIHTTVIGPTGRMVEIQIRTHQMNKYAEEGIAAHWLYKQGGDVQPDEFDKQLDWIKELMAFQKEGYDPTDFLENLKTDLFQDEIFVFTPNGDLTKLPKDSTPVDFAFAIHSDVGLHCIGCKVNGKIVSLDRALKSGEVVEILTSVNQTPSKDWLDFVKTSKARNHIKRWFRDVMVKESIDLGEDLLRHEFKRLLPKKAFNKDTLNIEEVWRSFKFDSYDSLLVSIGRGNTSARQVVRRALKEKPDAPEESSEGSFFNFLKRSRGEAKGIRIQGLDNMMVNFAKCCNPIPGDDVVGYITRGRGVSIHRKDCMNVKQFLKKEQDRHIEAEWDLGETQEFMVQIQVVGTDRKGLLKDITLCLSSSDVNIVTADVKTHGPEASSTFIVEIKNLAHLNALFQRIRKIPGVLSTGRLDETSSARNQA